MITAVIIDDEPKIIDVLKMLLEKYCPDVKVVGEAGQIDKSVKLIEKMQPQLLFLDIELGGQTGFDLLEKLKDRNFHVIFVTAFSHFAVKAFRFSVVDFLLKPIDIDELKEAVAKVKSILDAGPPDEGITRHTIRIPSTHGTLFVHEVNLVRFQADGAYTRIYLEDGKSYMSSYNIKQFQEQLDPSLFMRVHRSHLINLEKIKYVSSNEGLLFAYMEDGTPIEIARRTKSEFMNKIRQS
jgi:two-component system, LytTR family, response regulator